MSLHTSTPPPSASLESILRQAGAVSHDCGGRVMTGNFGSAAGELAACVRAVGLADCSQMVKLVMEGRAGQLSELISELAGAELLPGGAVFSGQAWWCADSPNRTIVLAEAGPGLRLAAQLHSLLLRHTAVALTDHSRDWAALAVIGSRAQQVLADLGVYGEPPDPRRATPLTSHAVAGTDVTWLLESDHKALALMPREDAGAVWRALEHAGHPYGMCAVGQEAVARYGLIRSAQTML